MPDVTAAIGVDIGGSAIKFAVVDQAGRIIWPPDGTATRVAYTVETPGVGRLVWHATGETEEIPYARGPADRMAGDKWIVPVGVAQAALHKALGRIESAYHGPVAAVGIGATGLIGPNGVVNDGVAFTGYPGFDWRAVVAQAGYGCAVRVLNDARAGAWAEYARTGVRNGAFLHVTAGTRVGCALIEDGRFLDGADSCSGEFSYLQLISPDGGRYRAQARLMDGLIDDPKALGVALVGVIHVTNPNRIVLCGFGPEFVAQVQNHLDRYIFATHLRVVTLEAGRPDANWEKAAYAAVDRYQENPGSLLYVARAGNHLSSALVVDGRIRNANPDFLGNMIVCASVPIAQPGDVCFGEIGGSFGIETAYAAHSGRAGKFDEIAAHARTGELDAIASLETAAKVTAVGIVNVCHMVSPSLITVGGAIPSLYPAYLPIVKAFVAARLAGLSYAPTIQPGATGNDAGVIGAALYALSHT